ncbi:uncharacterized protein LOC119650960 isoform X3 [Hermetia illucens]|uniref:uncharacterized protein LOC119650960 isoform X3 n=1 Tax=Hermetia illucens TaxID=343691 RepID=UPI0018CC3879|nr:uncharacterized protein LOC119650960 isoform X3 [Hermetia illucens]
MMDPLDYDGMFSSTDTPTWMLSPFDQQDATFLSSSRQMLETIVEETSDDEEIHQSWSQFENVWSEESDTGSVIRIELHNDQDSISERDFACPPKRPRHDDLLVVDELSITSNSIRKFPRNENLLIPEITTDSPGYRGSKRFDELYSDSDTLSYNSLSRSSSLIQFESLERQLQGGDLAVTAASAMGQSSPSLATYDNSGDMRAEEGCIRRYESSDGRLHQTYFDLAKIEFNNDLIFRAKSDSESSDNSILSHEERVLKTKTDGTSNEACVEAERAKGGRSANDQRACYKGKNSAENLSEDSGYCEYISALRIKSKSIPNFLRSNEKFCEEDEFFENHKSLEMIYDNSRGGNARHEDMDAADGTEIAAKHENNVDLGWYNGDVKNKMYRENISCSSPRSSPSPSPSRSTASSPSSTTSSSLFQRVSSSLPNVRLQFNHDNSDARCQPFYHDRDHAVYGFSESDNDERIDKTELRAVASVPNNLYLNETGCEAGSSERGNNDRESCVQLQEDEDNDFIWNLRSPKFVRSQNRSSGGKKYLTSKKLSAVAAASAVGGVGAAQNYLNASYNNLTLLDYSGHRSSFNMSDYSGNSKRSSREFDLGKGNFLLDEISSHFDKNLSILSGRERDSDLISEFLKGDMGGSREHGGQKEGPEMRRKSEENLSSVVFRKLNTEVEPLQRRSLETFDVSPTNLKTAYAESLESCDFDCADNRSKLEHSTPIKRGLVASTPNLNTFKNAGNTGDIEDQILTTSSAHNSLAAIPGESKRLGILISGPAGSRNSLGKGVSFCPFVSEISFREQSSEEAPDEPDSLEDCYATNPVQSAALSADRDTVDRPASEQMDHEHSRVVSDQTAANSSDRVGVQQTGAQVLAVNSEIINKRPSSGDGSEQQRFSHNRSAATISNESIVEECGLVSADSCDSGGDGGFHDGDEECDINYDIPITVEMFASDQMSSQVNVPSSNLENDNARDRSPNSVSELVAKINNNNNSGGGGNNNCGIGASISTNGNGNQYHHHQQQQQPVEQYSEQSNYRSNQKMPNYEVNTVSGGNGNGNTKPAPTTGTDLLSAKFKPKPDEKRHKNGFLSRFAGGFRFSLRRKKKSAAGDKNTNEQPLNYSQQQQQQKQGQVASANSANKNLKSSSAPKNTPDYVYIPLRDPSPNRQITSTEKTPPADDDVFDSPCNSDHSAETADATPERHLPFGAGTNNIDKNHVLLVGKPPLPKQPPRVVGVCEKVRAGPTALSPAQQYQATLNMYTNGGVNSCPGGNGRHAQVFRSKSQPREIDERFLDSERNFYYNNRNQLIATMNGNGCSHVPYVSEITDSDGHPVENVGGKKTGKAQTLPMDAASSGKIGLIETNLDTQETVITGKTRSLMELGPQHRGHPDRHLHHHHALHNSHHHGNGSNVIDGGATKRPHKSMEFLLDKENQKNVLPPENELQKSHDNSAALSEHQLRVQASLQRLNIPDWFRQYNSTPKTETGYKLSNFNRKRASESGRWAGLNSKTTSLSSLGSQRSDRSPLMLSPSAHSHHGGQTGFSRWSTSHLNSTQTSPSVSTRGSFSRGAVINSSFISGHSVSGAVVRNAYRQPYLGWRSQEKLALAQPRTPHERLASSVLAQQQQHEQEQLQKQHHQKHAQQEPPVTPEIQSSIKEVTSAIVHYVNDQTNRTSSRSRSTSPSSRKCWVESSFVGIKPVESPQTPVIENSFNANAQTSTGAGGQKSGATMNTSTHSGTDILRMNGVGDTVNDLTSGGRLSTVSPNNLQVDQQSRFRRRSEGDAQRQQQQKQNLENGQNPNASNLNQNSDMLPAQSPRRVSLDSSESKTASDLLVRCRNTRCDQMALASEAKKAYKSCHNCSHQYCSRECRRAHWEKHRKACLHSRVSNLCRQVLSSCKDDTDTLRHLSLLARKGYFSQGRGVVRILFRSPESAEAFIKNGFQCLGEASYVRWPDLMPAEMGLELYSELLRLSTEYKPDSKMLIYVAICVVSEAPGTGTAPVKWERQLVSRCAKLKLCKTILNEVDPALQQSAPPQEPFTEILILTFNTQKKTSTKDREIISVNIQTLLSRRGVSLRKHYPEIYQRLQNYVEAITDKFAPVTIHPRDSQTGQGFVCIIMPNSGETELSRLPKSDTGNRVSTFDVGEELFES